MTDPEDAPGALGGIPASFWTEARAAEHRLLSLDYDGTLAPFRTDRHEAVPFPHSMTTLSKIVRSAGTTVAVVSGRPVEELDAFLGGLGVMLVGECGWEEMLSPGVMIAHHVDPWHVAALDHATDSVASRLWSRRLERKRASVMLHTRGLPTGEAAKMLEECESQWLAIAAASGLRLTRVDGGLELRVPGRDKGTTVEEILRRSPARTFPVHIGDDVADEEAFSAIEGRGLGVRIAEPGTPTRARGRLASWIDIPLFFRRWVDVIERRDAS
ncbi:MAG TPA: trehalose-phosphatase [Verrucomicrobiae bacterium]|nr:trehalose-phosphatase [Verrucomicrobiae bacterium]